MNLGASSGAHFDKEILDNLGGVEKSVKVSPSGGMNAGSLLRNRKSNIVTEPHSQRGRGITDRGVAAPKALRVGFKVFKTRLLVQNGQESAVKFSAPFLLSPLPLYPSATYSFRLIFNV